MKINMLITMYLNDFLLYQRGSESLDARKYIPVPSTPKPNIAGATPYRTIESIIESETKKQAVGMSTLTVYPENQESLGLSANYFDTLGSTE